MPGLERERSATVVATRTRLPYGRLVAIAMVCLCAACQRAGQNDAELPLPPEMTGKATRHAVESRELRSIMSQISRITFERLPQELDDPGQRRERLKEAGSIAANLAEGAGRIEGVVEDIGLPPNEREVFLKLAARLREEALKLRWQADQGQAHLLDSTMNEINATCEACHGLFRKPGEERPNRSF